MKVKRALALLIVDACAVLGWLWNGEWDILYDISSLSERAKRLKLYVILYTLYEAYIANYVYLHQFRVNAIAARITWRVSVELYVYAISLWAEFVCGEFDETEFNISDLTKTQDYVNCFVIRLFLYIYVFARLSLN